MRYNFDRVIDRRGTKSLKYDFARERGRGEDEIPMWVADMDFAVADTIREDLTHAVTHGIYGYSEADESYYQALIDWERNQFGWRIQKEWVIKTPGIVFALAMAVQAYSEPGECVLIQQPVYYPFKEVIGDNGRQLVNCPLQLVDCHYEIDFERLEKELSRPELKLFLFCSPHNPVGRVWKEEELRRVAELCLKYQVVLVSDEIHADFVFYDNKHIPLASLDPSYASILVTCTSPSKSFNLAGLQISNIMIADEILRQKFQKAVAASGYSQVGLFGLVACQSAYTKGEDWLIALRRYLQDNLDYFRKFLQMELPSVRIIEPEGTYLLWVDFRALGLSEEKLEEVIRKGAKLWLDSGMMFGADGKGFQRFNIACTRKVMKQALWQLKEAIEQI